jgi:hypothetical protein
VIDPRLFVIRSNSLLTMFSLQITAQSMCIEINMNRVALVARHQPVPVKLSEWFVYVVRLCGLLV